MTRPATLTPFGNAQIDTAQSKFGGASLLLDGAGDYARLASGEHGLDGLSTFTVEGWFRFQDVGTGGEYVFNYSDGGFQAGEFFLLFDGPNGSGYEEKLRLFFDSSYYYGSTQFSYNTWYHIAFVKNGTSLKVYVNGSEEISGTSSASLASGKRFELGFTSSQMKGHVDEFRLSSTARYTTGFTAPTAPFVNDDDTLVLFHFDGTDGSTTFTDDTGSGRSAVGVSAYGNAQVSTSNSQFGGASAYFDGSGDYIISYPIMDYTNPWTIEFWFDTTSVNKDQNMIVKNQDASVLNLRIASDNKARIYLSSTGSTWNILSNALVGTPNSGWNHYAVSWDGSTYRTFLNGVAGASASSSTPLYDNNNTDTWLGTGVGSTAYYFGYLDEIRFSSTARYTGNFTPATEPFVNDADTMLLLHMDGTNGSTTFIDDTGGRNKVGVSALGNAQVDTAQSKFGGASLLANGGDDRIKFLQPDINTPGEFTVEFWFRPSSVSGIRYIGGGWGGTPGNGSMLFRTNGSSFQIQMGTSQYGNQIFNMVTVGTVAVNNWYHFAVSWDGTTYRTFLNGTAGPTKTSSSAPFDGTDKEYSLGTVAGTTADYTGHIDEFRMSSVARYTTGFTPSTTAFEDDENTLILLHMDGTDTSTLFLDDNSYIPPSGVTQEGAAALSSSFTETASASRTRTGTVTVNAAFAASTTVGRIRSGEITIASAMTASIVAVASLNGSIDIASAVSFTATADRSRATDVTLNNIVNLSLQGARIRAGESALSTSITLSADAARTRDTDSPLAVSFTQSTDPLRIKQLDSDLGALFTPSILAVASKNGSSDFAATTTIAIQATRIQPAASAINSAATITAEGGFLQTDSAALTAQFTQTASAIEYRTKRIAGITETARPRSLTSGAVATSSTTQVKWGTHSALFVDNDNAYRRSGSSDKMVIGTNNFIFEGWIYLDTDVPRSGGPWTIAKINGQLEIATTQGDDLIAYYYDSTGTKQTLGSFGVLSYDNQWLYLSISRTGSTISLKRNTSTVASASYSGAIGNQSTSYVEFRGTNSHENVYIDGWTFRIGNSTATGYSSAPKNSYDYTRFLYQFDVSSPYGVWDDYLNDFSDITGAATLNSTASITANTGGTLGGAANLNSTATLNIAAGVLQEASAALSTSATQTTVIDRIRVVESDLNAVFSQTASFGVFRRTAISLATVVTQNATISRFAGATSGLNAQIDLNAQIGRIKQFSADFDAFYTQLSAATKIGDFFVNADVVATQTVAAEVIAGAASTLGTTASLAAEATRIQQGASSLSSTATVTADAQKSTLTGVILSSAATQTALGDRIRLFAATIESAMSASLVANVLGEGELALYSNFGFAIEPTWLVYGAADFESNFTQTAAVIKAVEASATLASAGGFTIDVNANRVGEIELITSTTQTATANQIKGYAAELASAATQTATVGVIKQFAADFTGAFTPAINAGVGLVGEIDMATTVTLTAEARLIRLNVVVYTIPRETRTHTIHSETRAHTISQETRTYTIGD